MPQRRSCVCKLFLCLFPQDDQPYIIEANPRASRTVPFVAKAVGHPIAKYASLLMSGKTLKDIGFETVRQGGGAHAFHALHHTSVFDRKRLKASCGTVLLQQDCDWTAVAWLDHQKLAGVSTVSGFSTPLLGGSGVAEVLCCAALCLSVYLHR